MRKTTKVWLITAASLIVCGCVLFAGVMTILKWDFTKLSTTKYETNTYEVGEAFDGISLNTDAADIVFALSDDGKCEVVCHEDKDAKHSVTVENNTLVINTNPKSWYYYIGLGFDSSKVTLYLPKSDYTSLLVDEDIGDIEIPHMFTFKNADISLSTGDVRFYGSVSETLKIKTTTGDIYTENISAGSLVLNVTTGKVTASGVACAGDLTVGVSTGETILSDIRCKNLISNGSTGDISINNTIAEEKFSVKRSTGSVKFSSCDAAEIFAETDTGDVTGSLLSDKVFITESDTGSVDVPKTVTGGRCEIITDTGDIKIKIE